jgi:hypothetical protein
MNKRIKELAEQAGLSLQLMSNPMAVVDGF